MSKRRVGTANGAWKSCWRALLAAFAAACAHDAAPTVVKTPPTLQASALLLWRNAGASGDATPVVDSRAVYSLDVTHTLAATAKSTGQTLWKTTLPVSTADRNGYGLNFAGNLLVVGDIDLFGVDPATGRVVWTYAPSIGRRPGFQMQSSDGTTVYCGSVTGEVYAVDGATGHEQWVTTVVPDTNVLVFDPVVANSVVYVGYTNSVSGAGGTAAIDARTGHLRWALPLPQPDPNVVTGAQLFYTGVVVAGGLVISPSGDGTLYGLDTATGAVRYTVPRQTLTQVPDNVPARLYSRQLATFGSTVIVTDPQSSITALDAGDLHRLWIATPMVPIPNDIVSSSPIGSPTNVRMDGQFIYVTYFAGAFAELRAADGGIVWTLLPYTLRTAAQGAEGIMGAAAIESDRIYLNGQYETYAFKKQ